MAGKTELAVILGTLQRQTGYVVLIENGELQARAVKALRDRTQRVHPSARNPNRPSALSVSLTLQQDHRATCTFVPAAKTADLFVPAPQPLGRLPPVPETADDDSDFDSGEIPTDELDRLGQAPSPQKTPPAPMYRNVSILGISL
jgi:hypothetical protein